jgi:formate dehydrogenase iron-sulfur subunit
MEAKPKALLVDITKCIGCKSCETRCKEVHGFPQDTPTPVLSATAFTVVEERADGKFVRRMCQHCNDPACASVCPVKAIEKTPEGPVIYNGKKCIGCRYCMIACPNQVPKYQWTKLAPYMQKCDMCVERVRNGQPTNCAEVCPVGATIFGDRDEMLKEARKRLDSDPNYVQHIYGDTEFGGSSVLFISDVPFEKLGFVIPKAKEEPLPALSAAALGDVPTVAFVGGSLLAGLYWITQRRRQVLLAEGKFKADSHEERK